MTALFSCKPKMSIFKTFKQGQIYAETWPLHPRLAMIFPENRVIKATRFAQKLMPFIAVFAIVWQQYCAAQDMIALSAAVLTALFALCIPLQGLYWLGKRSATELSPQSTICFYQITEQLQQIGANIPYIKNDKLNYMDLAILLKTAKQYLTDEFWKSI